MVIPFQMLININTKKFCQRNFDHKLPDNNVLYIQDGVDLKSSHYHQQFSRTQESRQAAKCTFHIVKHFNS